MSTLKIEGVILQAKPFFEKDKIIEVFSKEFGRCRLLAKGACVSKSKFGGSIEPPNRVQLIVYKGRSFFILNHSDFLTNYKNIRLDFNKINLVFYIIGIIKNSTIYHQKNKKLFELLIKTLDLLETENDCNSVKEFFHINFLLIEGLIESKEKKVDIDTFRKIFEEYSGKKLYNPILF
jgi:DNA repair protein RecO (recombination protein O)